MNKFFVKWFLTICLIGIGVYILSIFDMWKMINDGDVTKISFAIFILFLFFSLKMGYSTYTACAACKNEAVTAEWMADKFVTFGMIGTVIGFLYTLNTCFGDVDVTNPTIMQGMISKMATGMGTALYTTASGLICSTILKIQIYNYKMCLSEINSKWINKTIGT